jgi:hypothetical protein
MKLGAPASVSSGKSTHYPLRKEVTQYYLRKLLVYFFILKLGIEIFVASCLACFCCLSINGLETQLGFDIDITRVNRRLEPTGELTSILIGYVS